VDAKLVAIGELAQMLGVGVVTLRRWHRSGKLVPVCRTYGNHGRYDVQQVRQELGLLQHAARTIAYARVSSHDQKAHLVTQGERLRQHSAIQGWADVELVTDLGSGPNYFRKGLLKVLREILFRKVSRLVLITKDRLLRFGSELIFHICGLFGVEVVVLDSLEEKPREQQLTEYLVEILTVFSSRLYGSRSRKNSRGIAQNQMAC
jgi:predicted site-specific integrase-resolvase